MSFWILKHWHWPYFSNIVYPCGHYRGLLCHFNNQICKFPLSSKSKQSNLKVIDTPGCASASIKPDVLLLPLPRASIFLWSIVKAGLSMETSLMFTQESINHSTAVMLYRRSILLPFCNYIFFQDENQLEFSLRIFANVKKYLLTLNNIIF